MNAPLYEGGEQFVLVSALITRHNKPGIAVSNGAIPTTIWTPGQRTVEHAFKLIGCSLVGRTLNVARAEWNDTPNCWYLGVSIVAAQTELLAESGAVWDETIANSRQHLAEAFQLAIERLSPQLPAEHIL